MTGGSPRHFLDIGVVDASVLRGIIDQSRAAKQARKGKGQAAPDEGEPLQGKLLAMIFEKPSTRTRVSFDVAMRQLGGQTVLLNGGEMQLGRGETIADTARVLSRYVDAIMIRTTSHNKLIELAEHATIPVINGLTDQTHPCQLMADVMTYEEHRGAINGGVVAWSGDGNNVSQSWIEAAAQFKFEFRVACPEQLRPSKQYVDWARKRGAKVTITDDPYKAVSDADCIVTDTWVSMGDGEQETRHNLLAPFRVDENLMSRAKPNAIFMHCLPAHRGEEVTEGVIDGPQSVVWDGAENRLHAQKGVLSWCLG